MAEGQQPPTLFPVHSPIAAANTTCALKMAALLQLLLLLSPDIPPCPVFQAYLKHAMFRAENLIIKICVLEQSSLHKVYTLF